MGIPKAKQTPKQSLKHFHVSIYPAYIMGNCVKSLIMSLKHPLWPIHTVKELFYTDTLDILDTMMCFTSMTWAFCVSQGRPFIFEFIFTFPFPFC